jgi:hypothetical protein
VCTTASLTADGKQAHTLASPHFQPMSQFCFLQLFITSAGDANSCCIFTRHWCAESTAGSRWSCGTGRLRWMCCMLSLRRWPAGFTAPTQMGASQRARPTTLSRWVLYCKRWQPARGPPLLAQNVHVCEGSKPVPAILLLTLSSLGHMSSI